MAISYPRAGIDWDTHESALPVKIGGPLAPVVESAGRTITRIVGDNSWEIPVNNPAQARPGVWDNGTTKLTTPGSNKTAS